MGFEQHRGAVLIAEAQGKLRTKRATDVDRTWAVRYEEERKRQRERDIWREKYRPILSRRKLVTMRTTGWDWT